MIWAIDAQCDLCHHVHLHIPRGPPMSTLGGVTEQTDRCEEGCPVCQVAMAADKLQPAPAPSPSPDELARKQRVIAAIGVYMSKPAKPPRRWRR